MSKRKEAPVPEYQSVVLTFSDGTVAVFGGPVVCRPGDTRRITKIAFTEPEPLPEDCSWGLLRDLSIVGGAP